MDYDEQSLNSLPTMADGARRYAEPSDEPSLGSAPTMAGQGVPGAALGQIDQYQLVRKLGGGGFGVVYLARDTVSGVDVALKTLHPLLKSNPEEMEALRAKFALVSRLSHTNIASPLVLHPCRDIAITDDGVRNEMRLSPGDFIMVMRYAPGVTLSKWRRQFPDGVVPPDQALEVVRQVASALDYAHGEKIVHRDIKPANVMVETLGGGKIRIRILDFGLAAEIRSSMSRISTETGDTSGTRPYMAPEQWLGRKQDGRTDQYALACVAYEMLSGAPPFSGAFETGDLGIMERAVTARTPEEIEDVPAYVNAALIRALAKNPKERFNSCAEFVDACLAHENLTPKPQRTQSDAKDGVASQEERANSSIEPQSQEESQNPSGGHGWLIAALFVLAAVIGVAMWQMSDTGGGSSLGDSQQAAPITTPDTAPAPAPVVTAAARQNNSPHWSEAHPAGKRKVIRVGSQEIALRWCPPGTFMMGSPPSEDGHVNGDETQHRVTLTKGFWMGEMEVTQGLWKEVMGTTLSQQRDKANNSWGLYGEGDNYPMYYVSWEDCQEFLNKLNARSSQAGLRWALPTEAQWEYACRAGTTGAYGGTGRLGDMGWYTSNSSGTTHPVKQKQPNAWGLYDMHGNVWEWCRDWYGNYPSGAVTDPGGAASGVICVLRGGSYCFIPLFCRSASRHRILPGIRDGDLGFRIALIPFS